MVQQRDALRYKKKYDGLSAEEVAELDRVSQEFLEYRTGSEARGHERVQRVREIVAKYKDRAQIFVGGITMITADMITYISNDLVTFGAAVIAFMIAFLALIFRSLRFVVIPMLCCITAVLMMLGYVSWLDWRLTVISSNFVALLLIISLAIIIHLVVRYREFAADNPDWDQKQLAAATVRFMARPCLYTALTTIVAFVSLVVSDIRPVIDFGWMMTMGLVVALTLAFLVMPASLVLLPREKSRLVSSSGNKGQPFTLHFSKIVEKHGSLVLAGGFIVAILSVVGISRLQVENRFIDYFHDTTEIYQGLSVIDSDLGGTTTLDILINTESEVPASDEDSEYSASESGEATTDEEDPFLEDELLDDEDPFESSSDEFEDDPFSDGDAFADESQSQPSYWLTVSGLKRMELLHDYLESLPEVGKVQSLATLYKVGKDINGSLNNFELALMERSLSGDVRDVLISPYVSENGEQTRVTLRVRDGYPGLKRKELVERIEAHMLGELGYKDEDVRFSGLLVLYNNMLQSLFSSQIVTIGVVFVCIMAMFIVLFRSFLQAVVGIIPNILAASFILGMMGLFGLPLDMMTITIAAITVGIGVDNTIHYIHRFKREIAIDGDFVAAMHRSHRSIGRAMYYTSIIIIFGFSIMTLSEFIPTVYFGMLTGVAMFAALMGALLLLPKLILWIKPFPEAKQAG